MPIRGAAALVIAFAALLIAPHRASAQYRRYDDGLPPEIQRLLRQAHDYAHNSNGNVFRSSRQFSPDRNPFRSSRHYQQKLAAAYEARPVRTFVRFGDRIGGGPRFQREFDYAHHLGRYDEWPARSGASLIGGRLGDPATSILWDMAGPVAPYEVAPAPLASTADRPQPTQRAEMRRVTLPDGRVRTIIYSVPIDDATEVADDGASWAGDADRQVARY